MAYFIPSQYLIDKILEFEPIMSDSEFEVVEYLFRIGRVSHTQYIALNELHDSLMERNKKSIATRKCQLWN